MKMRIKWPWSGSFKFLLFITVTFGSGLQCDHSSEAYLVGTATIPEYDLASPSRKYELPAILREISGLSYYDKGMLACIQDEEGKMFLYDLKSNQLTGSQKFAGDDDYEGIEVVGDQVCAVNSSGDIFLFSKDKPEAEKYKTPMNEKYDIEGLAFRKETQELILACKENPEQKNITLFFSFDLTSRELSENPEFTIDHREVKDYLKANNFSLSRHLPFKPSGIALHPKDGRIFVLASVGKLLLVLTSAGNLLEVVPLPPSLFIQPEGLCFDPKGTLFIANEGKKSAATLLQYDKIGHASL